MAHVLRLSEAGTLGIHAAVVLAGSTDTGLMPAREIASGLDVSLAHLSKVLRRLERAGIVTSARGPNGGFRLARNPSKIKLLEIYEEFEGPIATDDCLLNTKACSSPICALDPLLSKLNKQVRKYLAGTKLSDLASGTRR